ncbi:MAG: SDR family oxidoreductase [Micromonosporaceae bacterium]|nr:SDR family oxidoreductase [Micromonosporaceae bacterium]
MNGTLDGKVVLITGAARGIGEQVARMVAARGARVAAVGLEPERLAALVAELGDRHAWAECDVTDQAGLDRAVGDVVARLGGIDVVVANAGVAGYGTVAVAPPDVLARTVEVNLIGVMRTVSATLPEVLARRGYLLLVSSVAAFSVLPGLAAYAAAKAGVEQFGNVLRLEVAHRGVAVGTAHPIWIDTDLVRDAREDLGNDRRLPGPLGRTYSVEQCATALVRGIERRQRRVFVPRSMALMQAARILVQSSFGDLLLRGPARTAVPELEQRVQELGRSFGQHSVAQSPRSRP